MPLYSTLVVKITVVLGTCHYILYNNMTSACPRIRAIAIMITYLCIPTPLYLTSYILHLYGRSSSILGKMSGELDTPKGMRQYGLLSTIHNHAGHLSA